MDTKRRPPTDFLAACRRAGRDPATVKDPEAYMRGWHQVGERLQRRRRSKA